jgi:glucosamine 6-phosphate synthetase-like amidotransferase/phosphosugar isomerase protein
VIGNRKTRRERDIDALTDTFTRLLLLSEHRGPHATGVAWVKQDGTMQVTKEPLPARAFVQSGAYIDWLLGIDRQVTYLMGHTRWPSRGRVSNPAENHPLCCAPPILLTHNGTIADHMRHYARLRLRHTTQVDSELLARIAQHHAGTTGVDIDAYLDALQPLDGSMSAALVATIKPEEIILLKGNMPLEVRHHRRKRVVLYASEAHILDRALAGEAGWDDIPIEPGEALVFDTAAIHAPRRYRFTFQGLTRKSGWSRFTGD